MTVWLHILKTEPDETVEKLITSLSAEDEVMVVSLYPDPISGGEINWKRLVDDLFKADRVVCWW